jgi:hypothetical protein
VIGEAADAAQRWYSDQPRATLGRPILRGVKRGDRAERGIAHMKSLPAQQQSALLLGLWLNAALTLVLHGVQLIVVVRVL